MPRQIYSTGTLIVKLNAVHCLPPFRLDMPLVARCFLRSHWSTFLLWLGTFKMATHNTVPTVRSNFWKCFNNYQRFGCFKWLTVYVLSLCVQDDSFYICLPLCSLLFGYDTVPTVQSMPVHDFLTKTALWTINEITNKVHIQTRSTHVYASVKDRSQHCKI
jgi:hypothetical protein